MSVVKSRTTIEDLVEYLGAGIAGNGTIDLRWVTAHHPLFTQSWRPQPLPAVADVVAQLGRDAAFQALRLGTLLDSPDGQLIGEAIARLFPWPESQAALLLEDALRMAAEQQREGAVSLAVLWGAVTIVAGIIVAAAFSSS